MNPLTVSAVAAVLWASVTPQNMLDPVPAFVYAGIPGAVQPSSWRHSKPLTDTCPIYDGDTVIGVSLGCSRSQVKTPFPSPSTLSK
jgi:hypothetical protein